MIANHHAGSMTVTSRLVETAAVATGLPVLGGRGYAGFVKTPAENGVSIGLLACVA